MRKNNIKYISIFIALICLIFSSCSDLFNDFSNTTLSVNVDNASSRNVLPESDISVFTDFKLEGTLDEQSQVLGTWGDYEALSNASITINPGKWDFTLSAKKDGITFTCNKSEVEIVKSENNIVSFSLSSTSNGKAKIKLTYPMGAGVKYVSWSILSNDGETKVMEDLCLLATESTSQSLTQGAFNLVKELSAGKYIFNCSFYSYEDSNPLSTKLIGTYKDFLIVESGLETKLEHDITYFEAVITSIESTDRGMKVTFNVPENTRNAAVYRAEVSANGSLINETWVMNKYYNHPEESKETLWGYDSYGFVMGKTYAYSVIFNWNSSTRSDYVYFTAQSNGWEMPEFSVYPEFETVENEDGITTQLKMLNNGRMNWKGHNESWTFNCELNYEDQLYPWFSGKNGGICDTTSLTSSPGNHNPKEYKVAFGGGEPVAHYFTLNINSLSGKNRPPVLHGVSLGAGAQEINVWEPNEAGFNPSSLNISDGTYTIITDSNKYYKINTVTDTAYIINWCDNYNRNHGTNYTIENDDWSGFDDARISLLNGDNSSVNWYFVNGARSDENDDETPMAFIGTGNPVYVKVNKAKCALRVWKFTYNAEPELTAVATMNGIQLTITNIPEGTSSINIHRTKTGSNDYADIQISKVMNGTSELMDYFVATDGVYNYSIQSFNGLPITNGISRVVTATGGSGELRVKNTPTGTYNSSSRSLTFTTEPLLPQIPEGVLNGYNQIRDYVEVHIEPYSDPQIIAGYGCYYHFNGVVDFSHVRTGTFVTYPGYSSRIYLEKNGERIYYNSRNNDNPFSELPLITIE